MGIGKTLLTFEDFEQLPDQPGKRELVRGELLELPPGDLKHHRTSLRIFKRVDAVLVRAHAGAGQELGEAFIDMGYLLPGKSWLQPDVSVTHAGQTQGKYFEGAPAIAIEILSPSNTANWTDRKAKLYFECGAREVWRFFQNSKHATIEVPGSIRTVTADSAITTPLLPGLALSVQDLFAG